MGIASWSRFPMADWLAAWAVAWGVPGLPGRVRFETSCRMRRALGRCYPTRGLVRLNARLIDEDAELVREVVCHETAHLAAYLLHGPPSRPHGPEWSALMRAAGYDPRACFDTSRLSSRFLDATRPRREWEHVCERCGRDWTAGRPMRRWRCRACWDEGHRQPLAITARPAAR